MASQLRNSIWSSIYINPDLSKQEREENKRLRAELRARKQAGETNLTIRRGKVVQLENRPGASAPETTGASQSRNVAAAASATPTVNGVQDANTRIQQGTGGEQD